MNYRYLLATLLLLHSILVIPPASAGDVETQASRNSVAIKKARAACAESCNQARSNCHANFGQTCPSEHDTCLADCDDPAVQTMIYQKQAETHRAATLGTCTQACGTTLAECQQQGRKQCPRRFQSCKDACEAPPKRAPLSKTGRKTNLCQQRCDYSAQVCADAKPNDPKLCDRGRMQCYERCTP